MLLKAAGLEEYEKQALATLIVVEWFNDRLQTAVNVTSDQFVAKMVDDIKIKANKKNKNIYCGCCIVGNSNNNNNHYKHQKSIISDDDHTIYNSIKEQEMV